MSYEKLTALRWASRSDPLHFTTKHVVELQSEIPSLLPL